MKRLMLAILALGVNCAMAENQTTQERCAAYAQRAVQQYQLMKSNPQCQQNTDPMNWQDNYDNHYNACRVFPAKMAEMADSARQNHLIACGAIAADGSVTASATGGAATGAAVATSGNGAAAAQGAAPGAAAAGAASTPSASGAPSALVSPAAGYGSIGCNVPAPLMSYLTRQVVGFGKVASLDGNMLVYHGSPTVTPASTDSIAIAAKAARGEYPTVTAVLARPKLYSTCRGVAAGSALGPWIELGTLAQPPRYFWIDVGGVVLWQQITPQAATAFLTGIVPAAAPAKTATPAPASKAGH